MENSSISSRISFASIKSQIDYPDFMDIQLQSFQDFFQLETKPENRQYEGLFRTFSENFPITDSRNQFVLEFLDYLHGSSTLFRGRMHRAWIDFQCAIEGTTEIVLYGP